jgi:hypothetical protein
MPSSDRMSELDRAVLAFRENPSEMNRRRLERVQAEHVGRFHRDRAVEYIERTK